MSFIAPSQRLLRPRALLLLNQIRCTSREEIHRYVEPPKFKKHMLAACEPYYKRQYLELAETCKGVPQKKHGLLPLEKILLDELLEDVKQSDYILIFQYNYTPFQSERVYKNTLTKLGGKFHALNNGIYREAFKTLNYPDISELFIARNGLLTGKAESLTECVKAFRKMSQFILLIGFIDKRLYNIEELKLIAANPDLDRSRASLLATLQQPALKLASNLEQYGLIIKPAEGKIEPQN